MEHDFTGLIIGFSGNPTEDEIKEMFKKEKELIIKKRKIEEKHRKGYENIPYRLRLCILDYIPIQIRFHFNSNKTHDEYIRVMRIVDDDTLESWMEIANYNKILFGYFKNDKYRKVFLIWTYFVIDEFSNNFNLIDIIEYFPIGVRKLVIAYGITIDESITRFSKLNEIYLENFDETRLEKSLSLDFGCSKLWIRDCAKIKFPKARCMDSVKDLTMINCGFCFSSFENLLKNKFENLAFVRCKLDVEKKVFIERFKKVMRTNEKRFDIDISYEHFQGVIFQNHLTTYLLNNDKLNRLATLILVDVNVFLESVLKSGTLRVLIVDRCLNPFKFDICRFAFQILTSNLVYVDLVDFFDVYDRYESPLIDKLKNQLIKKYKRNVRSKYKRLKVRFNKKFYIDFYNGEICKINKPRRGVFF